MTTINAETLSTWTVKDLRAYATGAGVTLKSRMVKADIIAAIIAAEAEAEAEAAEAEAEAAELPEYAPATGAEIDYMIGGAVMRRNVSETLLAAIRAGFAESGAWLLNDGHVAQGESDMAVAVYVGPDMVYALPIKAHGTRVCPATVYGDVTDAPVWYAEVDAEAATEAIRKNAHAQGRYGFYRANGGATYAVKLNRHGNPIARKFPIAKYLQMVCTCVRASIYGAYYVDSINWTNARNLRFSVKVVRDLTVA